MSFKVETFSDISCDLGEGPNWDHKSKTLYFVDAFAGDVCRSDISSGRTDRHNLKDLVTIVIPFEDNNNTLLVSLRNKVIKFNINSKTEEVIASIAPELEGKERFNDGKVDAFGRLWIGSVFDGPNGAVPKGGNLYKLDKNKFIKMSENFTLSNGISWNLNNTKMYFNDSEDRKIYVFDFDLQNGLISNKTVFVDFKSNSDFNDNEYPDGLTTDKNGKLWVSLYGGGRVVQINTGTGKVENFVRIPAPLTTSVAFGGQDLNEMFVTTGNRDQNLTKYPNAGKVFRVTATDTTFGALRPEPLFKP